VNERTPPDDADLRRLLHHAVDDVDPAPALDHIRDRTKATPMSDKRPWIYGALGAAAATAAVVVGVSVLSDDETTPVAGPGPESSATAEPSGTAEPSTQPSTQPSDEASDEASAEPSQQAGEGATQVVPVYYAGRTSAGIGLFREFHRTSSDGDALFEASEEAVGGTPLDPDYFTLWGDLDAAVDFTFTGGTAVIGLTGSSLSERPAGLGADEASLAVQQLVYTATAALQRNVTVEFELDERPMATLLGVDVSEGVGRRGEAETLAPVWVTSPQDGDTVGSTFTVEGQGAFFEATVSWQLLDDAGDVVEEGFTTAQECCVMSPYRFQVKGVDPGDYTLRVYQADTSGEPGAVETEDTKRLTVD
jgi:hypothetical protein